MKVRLAHKQILHSSDLSFRIDIVSEGYHRLEMLGDEVGKGNLRAFMLVNMAVVQRCIGLRYDGTGVRRFQYVCAIQQKLFTRITFVDARPYVVFRSLVRTTVV